ncbi:MAG: DUF4188 domain-containing protein [Rhodothermia bacterium]|nr:DUF4188 domain-containing protein [Rhodothermia bacterium]
MYKATFKFRIHTRDDQFDLFNEAIDAAARRNPGFVRKESWVGSDGDDRAVVYYWDSLDALERFSSDPVHMEAKRRYREWYDGYAVEVAEIIRESGDGRL